MGKRRRKSENYNREWMTPMQRQIVSEARAKMVRPTSNRTPQRRPIAELELDEQLDLALERDAA